VEITDGRFEITWWHQRGTDRLYVARPDGTRVGWWDVQAQCAHADRRPDTSVVVGAIDKWLAGQSVARMR